MECIWISIQIDWSIWTKLMSINFLFYTKHEVVKHRSNILRVNKQLTRICLWLPFTFASSINQLITSTWYFIKGSIICSALLRKCTFARNCIFRPNIPFQAENIAESTTQFTKSIEVVMKIVRAEIAIANSCRKCFGDFPLAYASSTRCDLNGMCTQNTFAVHLLVWLDFFLVWWWYWSFFFFFFCSAVRLCLALYFIHFVMVLY